MKRAAQAQWSHDPAGSVAAGDEPPGTPEFFVRVERNRYGQEQPWMHDTFAYEKYAGMRVLEIGVGLGTDHLQFARAGATMTGIDLTPRCIDLTARRFEQESLSSRLMVMDAEHLRFEPDSFDAVYSFGVLHHTAAPERAFAEVRRVLRPGGVFMGGLYSKWSAVSARIALGWVLSGEFRRSPLSARFAQVEYSSRGSERALPYVRLFSARELRSALEHAGFETVELTRRHLGLGRFQDRVPSNLHSAAGKLAGWYLIHHAR